MRSGDFRTSRDASSGRGQRRSDGTVSASPRLQPSATALRAPLGAGGASAAVDRAWADDPRDDGLIDGIDPTAVPPVARGTGHRTGLTTLLVVIDLLAIALGFAAASATVEMTNYLFGFGNMPTLRDGGERLQEVAMLSVLLIGVFAYGNLYRQSTWEVDEVRRVIVGVVLIALFDASLQFLMRDESSRLWFLLAYPFVAITVIAVRMGARSVPALQRATATHVVLLGTGMAPDLLMYQLRESRSGPVKLLSSVSLSRLRGREPEMLGRLLDRLARHAHVHPGRLLTVLAPTPGEAALAQNAIEMLNAAGRPYSIIVPFDGLARRGLVLRNVVGSDMVLAELQPAGWPGPGLVAKRLIDLAATLIGVVLISPLLIAIAGMLLMERGPVLFSQTRIGRGGRRFRCFKFRTMRVDAQERLEELLETDPEARAEWMAHQKLANDPRITPIGHFLRKTSLDELPQLLNVIWGDMSLVGPRPIIAPEVRGYPGDRAYYESADFAYYMQVTPGITGLWQVSGRAATTHDERVRLDRWYACNWSVWLDIVILFKTVRVVALGNGSS